MESLLAALVPPGVHPALAGGLVLLSFLTSALSAMLGLGGGVALLAVLATFVPPAVAIPVHGVVQLGSNGGRALLMAGHVEPAIVGYFALGGLAGIALGTRAFSAMPTAALQLVLALFILWSAWGPRMAVARVGARGFLGVGAGAGFLTMFVGGTGPFLAAFLANDRLPRHAVVATHAACMSYLHAVKALAFGFLGFQYLPWVPLLAAMLVAGLAGTVLGKRALDRLADATFRRLFRGLLTLLALRLLWAALGY